MQGSTPAADTMTDDEAKDVHDRETYAYIAGASDGADAQGIPIPPIGDVVHDIGDAVRREAERLRDAWRRRRTARMLELGLVLFVGYLLFFRRDD